MCVAYVGIYVCDAHTYVSFTTDLLRTLQKCYYLGPITPKFESEFEILSLSPLASPFTEALYR